MGRRGARAAFKGFTADVPRALGDVAHTTSSGRC